MGKKTPQQYMPGLEDVASANEFTGAVPAFVPKKDDGKGARKGRAAKKH